MSEPLPPKKYAVANVREPTQPLFFNGEYGEAVTPLGISAPLATGAPDLAKSYAHRAVAELLVELFNFLDGVECGRPQRHWMVVELPEAWL
jgi:hypothetical protein